MEPKPDGVDAKEEGGPAVLAAETGGTFVALGAVSTSSLSAWAW